MLAVQQHVHTLIIHTPVSEGRDDLDRVLTRHLSGDYMYSSLIFILIIPYNPNILKYSDHVDIFSIVKLRVRIDT